jgi:hypothetical protein
VQHLTSEVLCLVDVGEMGRSLMLSKGFFHAFKMKGSRKMKSQVSWRTRR